MADRLLVLLNLLEDEFRGFGEVRVRPVFPSGTRRSIDLDQDYDPNSNHLHRTSGVLVQTRKKEFYFPLDWMGDPSRSEILEQIQEIREMLGR